MFNYILNKINNAKFLYHPFKHIEINDVFENEHFNKIIDQDQIKFAKMNSDEELISHLENKNYKPVIFPGCVTNSKDYIKWHGNKKNKNLNVSSTEGFGMTYRLTNAESEIISKLVTFISSNEFQQVIAKKFSIDLKDVYFDQGIQKYLDGYEISPHPDLKSKALTFMFNINPNTSSEKLNHHTHYMRFKNNYKYVEEFWKGNLNFDRCWVPWDWCETIKTQTKNNSVVIFSPDNNTMHAVKAKYDHLPYQRTQLYGNLWYKKELKKIKSIVPQPKWENFVIKKSGQKPERTIATKIFDKYKDGEIYDSSADELFNEFVKFYKEL